MLSFIVLVILLQIYAALIPQAQLAGDGINETSYNATYYTPDGATVTVTDSRLPLRTIFSGSGVIFVIVMAAFAIMFFIEMKKLIA